VGVIWVVRIDQIVELFEGVYQSGRWLVTIYPGWVRISLTFLVPIAFAVTVTPSSQFRWASDSSFRRLSGGGGPVDPG
jgi:ABC-type uncharacterized transport system permease subunit